MSIAANPDFPPREPVYPAFLRLQGRSVVVVGGGAVAASKVPALLAAGARVTVVSPRLVALLEELPVQRVRRRFRAADLDGAWWVVAAASPSVNARVRRAADRRRIFVNAVDDPSRATAFLGAVLRRGDVTMAIGTGGTAPALAALLRDALDALLPKDVADWARIARTERSRQRDAGVPMTRRRSLLLQALARMAQETGEDP